MLFRSSCLLSLSTFSFVLFSSTTGAQTVIPDGTVNTTVDASGGNQFLVTGGTLQGANLFHSFSTFSPEDWTTRFDLTDGSYGGRADAITHIITRVTGNSPSTLNGLLQVVGGNNPDLFLINPNGIVFGEGASLDVPGSFMASTAESVLFNNGEAFGVDGTLPDPLLTINTPIGLQLNSNPGSIVVQGAGHTNQLLNTTPVSDLSSSSGLQVPTGQTLALVGGDLAIAGGILSAPEGRIELGSVTEGTAVLNSSAQGFSLGYSNASTFGDIQMTQQALASVQGAGRGAIQLQGQDISIQDGSMVLVQNQGNQAGGDIAVTATQSLLLNGASPDLSSLSSLVNETTAAGAAGDITIMAPQLTIQNGAVVFNRTFSEASGGNIVVNSGEVQVQEAAPRTPSPSSSALFATAHGSGIGGDVSIMTQNLSLFNSSQVGTRTYGEGDSGNVFVSADTIHIVSPTPPAGESLGPSTPPALLASSTFGTGNSGYLVINTRTLTAENGGIVSASSLSQGNAGNLTINASESIEVTGQASEADPSYIGATVRTIFFGPSSADAGSVTISTPALNISNGATVFVQNQGLGDGGTLTINADILQLDNAGSISASTAVGEGEGGNIDLQLQDLLVMRQDSFISAEAGGSGNGGNITIDAPVIVGYENSDIIANAFEGNGGNIQITTQSIFGLEFLEQLTPDNDITASSKFGVSGTVEVNEFDLDLNSELMELPTRLIDPSDEIEQGCAAQSQGSEFVVTGRGGVPANPIAMLTSDRTWQDVRDPSGYLDAAPMTAPESISTKNEEISEVNSWQVTADGQVELIAVVPTSMAGQTYTTCAARR